MERKHGKRIPREKIKVKNIVSFLREKIKDRKVIGGIFVFVMVTSVFFVSVAMRSKYTGYVATNNHHHLTATAVAFTNNWLDDGIVKDHFAMIPNPNSIEFSSLKDRSFYDSYPPGCIIPLYALAKITGTKEIDFAFVERWNLFNQYAVTLLLAFLVYALFLIAKMKFYIGAVASVAPTLINIFMPAPYYFFHSVYFSDMAVLLPFVLTVFLETVLPYCKNERLKKVLKIIGMFTMFWGMFTDYLYLCVLIVVYVKRLLMGEISFKSPLAWFKDSLKFAAPALIALALFGLQLLVNGPVRIIEQFFYRTAINDEKGYIPVFDSIFWNEHIREGYGENADTIIKVSLAVVIVMILMIIRARLFKERVSRRFLYIVCAAGMVILPCFMQVYLLRNHSLHDFAILKFSIVLAVVPFTIIPLIVLSDVRGMLLRRKKRGRFTAVSLAVVVVLGALSAYNVRTEFAKGGEHYFPDPVPEYVTMGNFIKKNTSYKDVVFLDNYVVDDANDFPQKIAHSKKRIYLTDNIQAIYDKVKDISGDYRVDIFSYGTPEAGALKFLTDASESKRPVVTGENMYLYKIPKDEFLEIAAMYIQM